MDSRAAGPSGLPGTFLTPPAGAVFGFPEITVPPGSSAS